MKNLPLVAGTALVTVFTLANSGFPFVFNLHIPESADPMVRTQQYVAKINTEHAPTYVAALTDYRRYLQLSDILHLQHTVAVLQHDLTTKNA